MSLNIAILSGNVGKDPETLFTQGGMAICKFSLATTKKVKGEKVTSWHNIVCFQKLAETVQQYVTKGSAIEVRGEISYQQWEQDGVKKYKTEIIAYEVGFQGGGKKQDSNQSITPPVATRQDTYQGPGQDAATQSGGFNDDLSDIPF